MIDSLSLGIFISISCSVPEPLSSLTTLQILCGILREDTDKEMHAASIVRCWERPPSSSHFRVCEQQRNESVLPLCSCRSVKWASSGPPRPDSSLPCCLPPRCCRRRTVFLQCHRSTQRRVAHTVLRMYLCYTHRYYSRRFRGWTLDRLKFDRWGACRLKI